VVEQEKVNIAPEALEALLDLSQGDMRRGLNVLQACHAAAEPGDQIQQSTVYECVGSPDPEDIRNIVDIMMREDWAQAIYSIGRLKQLKGLALADILTGLTAEFQSLDLKPAARISLIKGLAEIEWRLSSGGNESIQTSAVIGVVKSAMEIQA
jgi:replication factor C subunit 3/5